MLVKQCIPFLAWMAMFIASSFSLSAQNQEAITCNDLYQWVMLGENDKEHLARHNLLQSKLLLTFYTQRNCQPAWYNPTVNFTTVDKVLNILEKDKQPKTYRLYKIYEQYTDLQTIDLPMGLFQYEELTDVDVLITDAMLHYGYRLATKNAGVKDETDIGLALVKALQEAVEQQKVSLLFQQLKSGDWSRERTLVKNDDKEIKELGETLLNEDLLALDSLPKMVQIVNDSLLYKNIQTVLSGKNKQLLGEVIYESALLNDFYRQRNYLAAWQDGFALYSRTSTLLESLEKATEDGLQPTDYHVEKLKKLKTNLKQAYKEQGITYATFLVQLDILFTDAALHYAKHLYWGKINPVDLSISWDVERIPVNWSVLLYEAVKNQKVTAFFDQMRPKQVTYEKLKRSLAYYRSLEQLGTWPTVPTGDKLEVGVDNDRVKVLRDRLNFEVSIPELDNAIKTDTLLLPPKESNDSLEFEQKVVIDTFFSPTVFDTTLRKAVIEFQFKNGLATDGIVGNNTIKHLNVSLAERVEQILVNLERWRWLPNDLGEQYLLVNIPAYQLFVYENSNDLMFQKKVMVGKTYHRTPVFSEQMQYLDLNPYWTVPYSIASKEILPKLKRNASYLDRNNMALFSGNRKINPYSVDWANVSRSTFRYTIRQNPSAKNALGIVKFMFPNQYNIYLHDTPSKSLFVKTKRAYSHGCIRLEKPLELAEYLLKDNPKWTPNKIKKSIEKGKNKRVHLTKPLPIYILYFTTWVDKEDNLRFQPDVYSRDKAVWQAIK